MTPAAATDRPKIDLRLHLPVEEIDYWIVKEAAEKVAMTVEDFAIAAMTQAAAAVLMPEVEIEEGW